MDIRLERAIALAERLHSGQLDKAHEPYIHHCLRVCEAVRADLPDDIEAQCAAVLHDVIEDCDVGPEELNRFGVTPRTVELILWVSRNFARSYHDWIADIAKHAPASAKRIKLADLRDNGSPSRLLMIGDKAVRERLRDKYDAALLLFIEHM